MMGVTVYEVGSDGVYDCIVRPETASVRDMGFSTRVQGCLIVDGIWSLKDLLECDRVKLMGIRNFGETCLKEVESKLASMGLKMKD